MKGLLFLFSLFLFTVVGKAQERLSRAYLGPMLHDFKSVGGSFVYSFGINQYLGIGAGFDASGYETESAFKQKLNSTVASLYADVRGKIPLGKVSPFAFVQGGKPFYNQEGQFIDATAVQQNIKRKGQFMYGGGVGVSYKIGMVGMFVSYTHRFYQFTYDPDDANINGRPIKELTDKNDSVGILTAGVIF